MTYTPFVHLRVHSAYSLSEGAIKVPRIVSFCEEQCIPAVAMTDTNNLFGALEFALLASKKGVQPIIGCQLDVAVAQTVEEQARINSGKTLHDRLIFLVQSEEGYQNLLKLASDAFLSTDDGDTHTTLDKIAFWNRGLICLSGGPDGAISRLLIEGQREAAEEVCDKLSDIFSDRFYIEIQRHGIEVEKRVEPVLIDLAYDKGLPLVATNDSYYETKDEYDAHDALLCIAEGTYIAEDNRRRVTNEHYLKSSKEMEKLFSDLPEAINNTVVIAQRCAFMPEERKSILPPFSLEDVADEKEGLEVFAKQGLKLRLENEIFSEEIDIKRRRSIGKPYEERLAYELKIIIEMGFAGYFLIVADFIKWAKDNGIPVGPGRGSGAGSLVAWALRITDLDPLQFGLLFERFLNPERISMPDFDIDFCQDRRDEVISYVQSRYGAERVAQIITFGKLQARAVLRDVGRVLGMPYGQVDKLTKLVPYNPANPPTLQEAIDGESELRRLKKNDEQVAQLIDISLKLEGLYRHASTHAAGVIIGDRPLVELVPLYKDPRSDMPATQFSMKYAETAGLVKFDFLGLKTLTVLEKAIELIKVRDTDINLLDLPLNDKKTYQMLSQGDTIGVFQLESAGMRDVLRNLQPDSFEDIIALVALYRPGPMDNIPRYIACKHGREKPDYLHPKLKPILEETFGVMIYQEQVMQIAQELSGYTLGGADLLRRAMGKKIKAEMDAQRETFVNGAIEGGVERASAARIFEQVNKFAGYGFNKSHAAAYALIAYQTAYLKANFPVEFIAASMTLDMGNTDKLNVFRQELDRLDIPLLPPDINKSGVTFKVETIVNGSETSAVRYALAAIKNVGKQAMQDVVKERDNKGYYINLTDFASRLVGSAANKRQFESLAKAGVFDTIDANRKKIYEAAEAVTRLSNSVAQERISGQESLFGAGSSRKENLQIRLYENPDWVPIERLNKEFDAIGSYLSAHPLDTYTDQLSRLNVLSSANMVSQFATSTQKIAGVVINKQERTSAKGNRFAFVQLSDTSGVFEITIFTDQLAKFRELLEPGKLVLVTVDVRPEDDGIRLSASHISLLDEAITSASNELKIVVENEQALEGLKAVVNASDPGTCGLLLVLAIGGKGQVEIKLPRKITLPSDFYGLVSDIPGVVAVSEA